MQQAKIAQMLDDIERAKGTINHEKKEGAGITIELKLLN